MERRSGQTVTAMQTNQITSEEFIAAFEKSTIMTVGCIGGGRVGVSTMAIMAKR
jgi:hypothetical protein